MSQSYKCAILSAVAALFALLLSGLSIGFSGPAIDTMQDNVKHDGVVLHINPDSNLYVFETSGAATWFSSIVAIGAIAGSFLSGPFMEIIGRKRSLMASSPIFLGTWLWMAITNTSVQLYIARIANGIAVGIASSVAPTYIAEVSPTDIRGAMGAALQLTAIVGVMLAYLLGIACRTTANTSGVPQGFYCDWRLLCYLFVIPSALLGICMSFVPESPRWIALKGRREEALDSLRRLRGGFLSAEDVQSIENQLGSDEKISSKIFRSHFAQCKEQLVIGISLQVFLKLSGIDAALFYQTTIFQDAGADNPNTYAFGAILVQVLVTFASTFLMDRVGRKPLLSTGSGGMALCSFAMGSFFINQTPGWLGIAAMYGYMAFFSIGVGSIPQLVTVEIYPNEVRGLASSIATAVRWLAGFLVTKYLNDVVNGTSYTAVFFFFGCICLLGVIFTLKFVPETKGKSFEEIELYFDSRKQGYATSDATTSSQAASEP